MRAENVAREVVTGLFVVIGLGILIVLVLWVTGSDLLGGKKAVYEVLMKDAGGVRAGDQVRVAGIPVGQVESVALRDDAEWPVAFQVELDEAVPITSAGSAQFASDGLLGSRFLSIDPGPLGSPLLAKGKSILGKKKSGDLSQALAGVDDVVSRAVLLIDETTKLVQGLPERINPLLDRLNGLLREENVELLISTLETLRSTLDETGPRLPQLLAKVDATLDRLGEGVDDLPAITAEAQALLADLRKALGPDGERLSKLLESADGAFNDASATLDAVAGNTGELEAALRDLRQAAANLRSFSEALKERPNRLILPPKKPDRRPGDGVQP